MVSRELKASLLSVGLHVLVLALFFANLPWVHHETLNFSKASSLETRTLSEADFQKLQKIHSKRKSQQLVQSESLPSDKNLVAPLSQQVFQSKSTSVVDQNTRAARVGEFKNVLREGIQEAPSRGPASVEEAAPNQDKASAKNARASETLVKNLFTVPLDSISTGGKKGGRDIASVGPSGPQGDGHSATNDYLPDVSIGANTLLNTQEFKYFSFYERIRQKLSFQWESRLKNEFQSLMQQGVKQISGDRITKLRVRIQRDGSILRTDLTGTSGYHELDRAALEAFRAAAPFPNPPKALMDGQSELSIDWSFVVVTAEDQGVRLSVRRAPHER